MKFYAKTRPHKLFRLGSRKTTIRPKTTADLTSETYTILSYIQYNETRQKIKYRGTSGLRTENCGTYRDNAQATARSESGFN
jgi:hypothetical protein